MVGGGWHVSKIVVVIVIVIICIIIDVSIDSIGISRVLVVLMFLSFVTYSSRGSCSGCRSCRGSCHSAIIQILDRARYSGWGRLTGIIRFKISTLSPSNRIRNIRRHNHIFPSHNRMITRYFVVIIDIISQIGSADTAGVACSILVEWNLVLIDIVVLVAVMWLVSVVLPMGL